MSKQFRTIFGLRGKLLLMSAFLLVLPWLGYRYILEMEQYLSRGQQQVVLGTARALATSRTPGAVQPEYVQPRARGHRPVRVSGVLPARYRRR